MGWGFYMTHGCLQVFASELSVEARATALSLHSFFFFMGQTVGPIAYGFGLGMPARCRPCSTSAAIMVVLGVVSRQAAASQRRAERTLSLEGRTSGIRRASRQADAPIASPRHGPPRHPWHANCFDFRANRGVRPWTHSPTIPPSTAVATRSTGYPTQPPLRRFLTDCHEEFRADHSGELADYIPELKRANPGHFGIALVTIDGHVYEVGDSAVPFTIQSVSKAFVFALALEMVGEERVAATIGVEPSGEAFNSIRLTNDNRPFNPMVNAGAIACSGLIYEVDGKGAFERVRAKLSQFAGRELGVDEAVHASETATGNRNRAIAWLLRNYAVLPDDVDAVLDVYFRQCAILVTARDLAVMAATLANRGINPVTGVQGDHAPHRRAHAVGDDELGHV